MTGIFILAPILLIGILFTLLMVGKSFSQKGILSINQKFHFIIACSLVGVFFVMTILAEFLYPTSQEIERPPKIDYASPLLSEAYNEIGDNILAGKPADSPLLVASRTHEVNEQLDIRYTGEFYDFPSIYVERSEVTNNTIQEHIYKPFMFVNDYDYTERLALHLPTWENNTMTIVNMIDFQLKLTTYSDASLFKQFTSEGNHTGNHTMFFNSFGSTSANPIIHLIVPKDLEIIAPYDDVMFVEELREDEW